MDATHWSGVSLEQLWQSIWSLGSVGLVGVQATAIVEGWVEAWHRTFAAVN